MPTIVLYYNAKYWKDVQSGFKEKRKKQKPPKTDINPLQSGIKNFLEKPSCSNNVHNCPLQSCKYLGRSSRAILEKIIPKTSKNRNLIPYYLG